MLNIHSDFQSNNNTIQLHIAPDIQTTINNYFQLEHDQEVGGLLLGNIEIIAEQTHLHVTGILTATSRQKKDFLDEFRFNHEIWRDLYAKKAESFSEAYILGWFYGHPANHRQLSEDIIHIHKNFFQQPYQVACLINAITKLTWFYHWETDTDTLSPLQVVLAQAPLTLSDQLSAKLNKTDDAIQPEQESSKINQVLNNMSTRMKAWVGVALIITLAVIGLYPILRTVDEPTTPGNIATNSTTSNESSVPASSKANTTNVAKQSDEPRSTQLKESPVAASAKQDSAQQDSTQKNIEIYYVQSGDSLWTISAKYYGSGVKFYKIIEQNGLLDLKTLSVGMKLEIPLEN